MKTFYTREISTRKNKGGYYAGFSSIKTGNTIKVTIKRIDSVQGESFFGELIEEVGNRRSVKTFWTKALIDQYMSNIVLT